MTDDTKKVCVVDDDHKFCTMIADTLREDGYHTTTAFTGEEALAIYDLEPPDLILLDVAMPGINGFEVAATIRERETSAEHRAIIVIMTAHARSFSVSVGFHSGIDSYLIKPLTPQDVVAYVHQVLSK
ncbi:MAG: response regulator transcription factor [Aggregatilineales bacterium]